MASNYANKWLVRYYPLKAYNKLDIWNLEVIDIRNPISHSYQKEVMNAVSEYERIKEEYGWNNSVDGSIIIGNDCEWFLFEGNSIDTVLYNYSVKRTERMKNSGT